VSDVDELQLHRAVGRAAQAKSLIDNELVKEAFETLKSAYINAWLNPVQDPRDNAGREKLWLAAQIVCKVQSHLVNVAETGKVEQAHLDEIAGKKSLLDRIRG
jgi:hypothetical protein